MRREEMNGMKLTGGDCDKKGYKKVDKKHSGAEQYCRKFCNDIIVVEMFRMISLLFKSHAYIDYYLSEFSIPTNGNY